MRRYRHLNTTLGSRRNRKWTAVETLEEVIMNEHLGGHLNRTNIDEGAMQWLIDTFNPKTFLDIGCGPGGMVDYAIECGLEAMGIDGDPEVKKDSIYKHDFVEGPVDIDNNYDIGWSVEFVEHVYEDYMDNYKKYAPAVLKQKTKLKEQFFSGKKLYGVVSNG